MTCPECGREQPRHSGGCSRPYQSAASASYLRPYSEGVHAAYMERHGKSKQKAKAELPEWLRTRPRSAARKREAAQYAIDRGLELPWEGWQEWL